jgi:hypothetical protein
MAIPLLKRLLLIVLVALLPGCYKQSIRHVASDISLLQSGSTTREEVLLYWGEPEQRRFDAENREVWIYYQVKKSFLRRTPIIGGSMGSEQYDLAIITFDGDVVRNCTYRSLTEREMKKFEMGRDEPSPARHQ